MVTKQEQIAQFLVQYIKLPRGYTPQAWASQPWLEMPFPYTVPSTRPTAEQLAHELLAMSEFRALQLGTWLNTTNGQVITEAVEMVSPPFYRQDIELLVEALQLAAQLQAHEGQDKAGKVALAVIVAGLIFGIAAMGGRTA